MSEYILFRNESYHSYIENLKKTGYISYRKFR
jgi:hypothetical protein